MKRMLAYLSGEQRLIAGLLLLCLTGCSSSGLDALNPSIRACSSPNCVSSEDTGTLHRIEPLRPADSLLEAWQGVLDYLATQQNVTITAKQDDFIAAEFRTRLLRFVDDVEFAIHADEGVIAMRSASRVGFSDLGTNRRRLEKLRSALAAQGLVEPR